MSGTATRRRKLTQAQINDLVRQVGPTVAPRAAVRTLDDVMDCSNTNEQSFVDRAATALGCEVWRNGWPDFLVKNKDGKMFAVEVKAGADKVRLAQAAMFEALEAAGVPVFVWNPRRPTTLTHWRRYRPVPGQTAKSERLVALQPAEREVAS